MEDRAHRRPERMKADLHVHSWFSTENRDLAFLRSRDCYSPPEAVYRTARARGMDLVTLTDHDTFDGCREFLAAHPDAADFIPGEEVSCRFPDGDIEVHLGVYGMTEALHRELQPLRRNVFEVTSCLRQAGVVFALNHLLHFYRFQAPLESYLRLLFEVPALEARNGAMSRSQNLLIEECARLASPARAMLGGSDAHTLRRVGRTWTDVPGARTAGEFLDGLRRGHCRPAGEHGGTVALAGDVYGVVFKYMASLVGVGPRDHGGLERLGCVSFSTLSLPFQFIPLLVAVIAKMRERRAVARVAEQLVTQFPSVSTAAFDAVRGTD
jgi:predicted metal-dependent phosphoesterase TrpH